MISFFQRGFHFTTFITRRWLRSRRVAIRSRFYIWLDINICFDSGIGMGFDTAQELSKSFTRAILKPDSEDLARQGDLPPGIFLFSNVAATGLKLNLLRAVFLRLMTPASHHLTLTLDHAGCVLATRSCEPDAGPLRAGKVDPESCESNFARALRGEIVSRLVSIPISK